MVGAGAGWVGAGIKDKCRGIVGRCRGGGGVGAGAEGARGQAGVGVEGWSGRKGPALVPSLAALPPGPEAHACHRRFLKLATPSAARTPSVPQARRSRLLTRPPAPNNAGDAGGRQRGRATAGPPRVAQAQRDHPLPGPAARQPARQLAVHRERQGAGPVHGQRRVSLSLSGVCCVALGGQLGSWPRSLIALRLGHCPFCCGKGWSGGRTWSLVLGSSPGSVLCLWLWPCVWSPPSLGGPVQTVSARTDGSYVLLWTHQNGIDNNDDDTS